MANNNHVHQADDAFGKFLLKEKRVIRALLKVYVTKKVLDKLDLRTCRVEDGNFIKPDLSQKYGDVALSVALKTKERSYMIVENKSQFKNSDLDQIVDYVMLVAAVQFKGETRKLPLVLPILIYNGARPYRGPRKLGELVDNHLLPEELKQLPFCIDLHAAKDEDLLKIPDAGVGLYLLKHGGKKNLKEILHQKTLFLLSLISNCHYPQKALRYTLAKGDITMQELQKKIHSLHLKQNPKVMSTLDYLMQEGEAKGLIKGRLEGMKNLALQLQKLGVDHHIIETAQKAIPLA